MKPTVSAKLSLIITDASCLIILDKIAQLDLLPKLFDIIITTPEIVKEYGKVVPNWIQIVPVKDKQKQTDFAQIIDSGEASAIALAQEVDSDYIIIDDLQGRKLAAKLGLNIIGTLGILLKAKQRGLLALLKPVLEDIKNTNFRTSDTLIEQILRDAGE